MTEGFMSHGMSRAKVEALIATSTPNVLTVGESGCDFKTVTEAQLSVVVTTTSSKTGSIVVTSVPVGDDLNTSGIYFTGWLDGAKLFEDALVLDWTGSIGYTDETTTAGFAALLLACLQGLVTDVGVFTLVGSTISWDLTDALEADGIDITPFGAVHVAVTPGNDLIISMSAPTRQTIQVYGVTSPGTEDITMYSNVDIDVVSGVWTIEGDLTHNVNAYLKGNYSVAGTESGVSKALVANTYEVGKKGSGCNSTSVQDAVDALGTPTVWSLVNVHPGCYDEDVTVPSNIEVHAVIPNTVFCKSITSTGGKISLFNPPTPLRLSVPFDKTQVLFSYESDDGSNVWITADAGLPGSTTPAAYAASRGIVVTHGIIGEKIGADGFLSENDIRALLLQGGCEYAAQSWSHTAVSINTVMEEIVSLKAYLESLSANFLTNPTGFGAWEFDVGDTIIQNNSIAKKLSLNIRGFSCPGNWVSPNDTSKDADWQGYIGDAIRSTYEWAIVYGYNNDLKQWGDNSNMAGFVGFDKITAAWLAGLAPGSRIKIVGDHPTNGTTITQWKTVIDLLSKFQEDGLGQSVSTTMLHAAIIRDSAATISIPKSVSTGGNPVATQLWNSVINDPTFALSPVGEFTSDLGTGAWYKLAGSPVVPEGGGVARLPGISAIGHRIQNNAGYSRYKARIVAKNTVEASGATLQVKLYASYTIAGETSPKRLIYPLPGTISLTDVDGVYYKSFSLPSNCRQTVIGLKNGSANSADVLSCDVIEG